MERKDGGARERLVWKCLNGGRDPKSGRDRGRNPRDCLSLYEYISPIKAHPVGMRQPPVSYTGCAIRIMRSGPQHSVRRLPGSGQVQCTSWRIFAPFSSSAFKTIHGEQAGKRDRGESAVGARHIVREHDTTQPVLNKDTKRAQGVCPWSPSQGKSVVYWYSI